jgi:hypothetical protein
VRDFCLRAVCPLAKSSSVKYSVWLTTNIPPTRPGEVGQLSRQLDCLSSPLFCKTLPGVDRPLASPIRGVLFPFPFSGYHTSRGPDITERPLFNGSRCNVFVPRGHFLTFLKNFVLIFSN